MKKRNNNLNTFFQGGILIALLLVACSSGGENSAPQRPVVAVEATQAMARTWTEGINVTGSLTPKYELR